MSSSSSSPEAPTGPAQLNGWKDIAAYLGRSVRTVQRWEKDFGLPVRRFGVSRPESVFAIPREIDVWLLTAQGVSARSGGGADATPASRAEAPPERRPEPLFPRGWFIRMGLVGFVAAAILFLSWFAWSARQPGEGGADPRPAVSGRAPAAWHVDLDTLVVSDARGTELWRHRFPRELIADAYRAHSMTPAPRSMLGGIVDVDGDGLREVWFLAKSDGGQADTALYLFEHNGEVRWVFQPTVTVRFGTTSFGPSWIVDRTIVTAEPGGGPGRAIWAVLYDPALFPSSIQRLDPRTGAPLSAYWTNGSILTAALDQSASPPKLFVGACYNETRAGSLSVLDALNPNGSAPAEMEKYRCTSCLPGDPLAFLVFPKPARFRTSEATGPVETLTPLADGKLSVRVRYAVSDAETFAVGVITFDPSLTPVAVDTADHYLTVYRELAARGDAPAGAPSTVDPEREFFPLLRWDSAARQYVKVFLQR